MSVFTIEGNLGYREKPETLVGHYGIISETKNELSDLNGDLERTTKKVGHASSIEEIRRIMVARDYPIDTPIIEISTPNDAMAFVLDRDRKIAEEFRQEVSLDEFVRNIAEPDCDLLIGKLQLWQETRFPSPWFYISSKAKILDEIVFDPDSGWYRDIDGIRGSRIAYGLVINLETPIGNLRVSRLESRSSVEKFKFRSW